VTMSPTAGGRVVTTATVPFFGTSTRRDPERFCRGHGGGMMGPGR
jgi:hypothetical protein